MNIDSQAGTQSAELSQQGSKMYFLFKLCPCRMTTTLFSLHFGTKTDGEALSGMPQLMAEERKWGRQAVGLKASGGKGSCHFNPHLLAKSQGHRKDNTRRGLGPVERGCILTRT